MVQYSYGGVRVKIILTLNENGTIDVSYQDGATYPQITAVLQTAQLAAMERTYDSIKKLGKHSKKELKELKGQIYDIYNAQASLVLDKFAPEIEMRKDLTAEALLKAENEILDGYKKV
jgi:hypothetical protein